MNLTDKINELKAKHAENLERIKEIQKENQEINRSIKKLEDIEKTMASLLGVPEPEETEEEELPL